MPLRPVLILALLVQQLALLPALAAPTDDCAATACCEVIETTTCCGTVVTEMRCGKSGGVCLCGVAPADPGPAPAAPLPNDRHELGPTFLVVAADVTIGVRSSASHRRPAAPAIHHTHGETRALLCIWRT